MSEDLRPCPFCGGDDVKHALPGDDHEFIMCNDCGADMDRVNCQDDPVPAWNRRAGQQGEARPARAEVERLAEEAKTAWGRQDPSRLWDAIDRLAALATQAAPEAQAEPAGEPVAWIQRNVLGPRIDAWTENAGMAEAWRRAGDTVEAVYTHPAASGERDTLRALLREARAQVRAHRGDLSMRGADTIDQDELLARLDALDLNRAADGGAK